MAVLVAVNDTEGADRVITVAKDLADTHDEELVALHVITEESYERRAENADDYFRDDATHDAKQVADRLVGDALERADDVTVAGRVGTPASAILEAAQSRDVSYVVVGSRKRSPVGKALLGSTTQSILLHADMPVVAVPDES